MKAIITGSFDPMTTGHVEIVKKASAFFDELYVVALLNAQKNYLLTLDEKKEIMRLSLGDIDNVIVDAYDGLTADYMHNHGITKIVRGIRNDSDREYEQELSRAMKRFDNSFETIFIEADSAFEDISSTHARELLEQGESLEGVISENAIPRLLEIFRSK